MNYKCQLCDPVTPKGTTPIKTINSETDEFINDKGKYYHKNCYKRFLLNKKGVSVQEAERIYNERLKETLLIANESNQKDKFLKWVMEFYDGSLPSYFLKKLKSVREGTHEGIPEPITYETLLDIYKNMENYLRKLAAQKQIQDDTQRMNYDLAVVVGNYGKYKRFKEKQRLNEGDKKQIDKQIEVTNKVNNIKIESNSDKEFDIADVINELLL